MTRINHLILLFFFSFISFPTIAQLTFGTQVRPRAEFRNGFKTLNGDDRSPAFFIEQRARLFADYDTEKFRVRVNFQDVRIWGSTSQIYKTDPNVVTNVFEAWGLYRFSNTWSLKIGRMAWDYDNARFLGDLRWAAQSRSHDGMVFRYQSDNSQFQLDLGAAFNQVGFEPAILSETFYSGVNNYKTNQFLYLKKGFNDTNLSLLIHNDGRQVQADSSLAMRQTYGLTGTGNLGGLAWGGELFYQGGKNARDVSVNAFFVSAYLKFKTAATPITIGIDYLSGTSTTDSEDKSFIPLYGTNHKFYGYMDYFYVGNPHGQGANISGLMDVHLKTKFKAGVQGSLVVNTHVFQSAADLYNPSDVTISESKYLGTEVDLVYTLTMTKDVKFNLGYSQMFASESMELIKSTGDSNSLNNWIWTMIDFNPSVVVKAFQ
ncbi:MAG: alginate export family protein [Cytophagales bacterium]|nr:alginate export family protein [Cytophagales bacterium]